MDIIGYVAGKPTGAAVTWLVVGLIAGGLGGVIALVDLIEARTPHRSWYAQPIALVLIAVAVLCVLIALLFK